MKTHHSYITPTVSVVSFRVEEAFQSFIKLSHTPMDNDAYNAQNQQNWSEGGSLFGSANDWDN